MQFLIVFSGYGFTLTPAFVLLLVLNLFSTKRMLSISQTISIAIALVLSLYLFLRDYRWGLAFSDNIKINIGVSKHLYFILHVASARTGVWGNLWATLVGAGILLVFVAVLFHSILRWYRYPNNADHIIMLTIGASLSYVAAASLGRACFPAAGYSDKYGTLFDLGFVGLYFYLCTISSVLRVRCAGVLGLLLLLGSSYNIVVKRKAFAATSNQVRAWVNCYLGTEDAALCSSRFPPGVYLAHQDQFLQPRLQYFRDRELNLFKDS